jgi:hypothetical protein
MRPQKRITTAFNTLKYAEALKIAGVDKNQARAQAHALSEASRECVGSLATREDLSEFKNIPKAEISKRKTEVRAEIAEVKNINNIICAKTHRYYRRY